MEPSCFLCKKEVCTAAYILGACQVALKQGRFTFRHDSVLQELVACVADFVGSLTPEKLVKQKRYISFVKAGQYTPSRKPKHTGILHLTNDWKVISDISDNYVFPIHIALTALRPDLILYSNTSKRVIMIELTCPCEENMESWHSAKLSKYSSLFNVIQSNGWTADLYAIEVGARGFCSSTLPLKRLRFSNRLAYKTSQSLVEVSRK